MENFLALILILILTLGVIALWMTPARAVRTRGFGTRVLGYGDWAPRTLTVRGTVRNGVIYL